MSLWSKKKRQWLESAWLLGICPNGFDDLKKKHIHWINNGEYEGKKWFADPFILDYDECSVYLLVEEFDYQIHKGRIAKLTVNRINWEVIDCKILLDLDTHLSFPMIWRQGNEVYVCPENYHSGGWDMYRYDRVKGKLEFQHQIVNEMLTDAIIWKERDNFWLFSTYEPYPNGSVLTVWNSKTFDADYAVTQRVAFNENVGRNAGMFFKYGDKWIRPAQESNHVYGHSMSFQEVKQENGYFCFKEIFRFKTPHPIYDAGTHTYNQYKEMAVIDVKGYRYRLIAKIIGMVFEFAIVLRIKKRPILK